MQKEPRIEKAGMGAQGPTPQTHRIPSSADLGISNKRTTQMVRQKRRRHVHGGLIVLVTIGCIRGVPNLVLPSRTLSASLQPSYLVKVKRLCFKSKGNKDGGRSSPCAAHIYRTCTYTRRASRAAPSFCSALANRSRFFLVIIIVVIVDHANLELAANVPSRAQRSSRDVLDESQYTLIS